MFRILRWPVKFLRKLYREVVFYDKEALMLNIVTAVGAVLSFLVTFLLLSGPGYVLVFALSWFLGAALYGSDAPFGSQRLWRFAAVIEGAAFGMILGSLLGLVLWLT